MRSFRRALAGIASESNEKRVWYPPEQNQNGAKSLKINEEQNIAPKIAQNQINREWVRYFRLAERAKVEITTPTKSELKPGTDPNGDVNVEHYRATSCNFGGRQRKGIRDDHLTRNQWATISKRALGPPSSLISRHQSQKRAKERSSSLGTRTRARLEIFGNAEINEYEPRRKPLRPNTRDGESNSGRAKGVTRQAPRARFPTAHETVRPRGGATGSINSFSDSRLLGR